GYFHGNKSEPDSLLKKAGGLRWVRQNETLRTIYGAFRRKAFETSAAAKSLSLFHAFAYVPPGQLRIPTIPVVYDLSFVRFPDMHPRARLRSLDSLGEHIQSAPAIHTISRFSAQEIVDVFGVEPSRIAVIYPGVKPIFF